MFTGVYKFCEEHGHRKADCPKKPCYKCSELGHYLDICTNPDKRTCKNCLETGHVKQDCTKQPKKKLPFKVPFAVQSEESAAENALEDPLKVHDGWKDEEDKVEPPPTISSCNFETTFSSSIAIS